MAKSLCPALLSDGMCETLSLNRHKSIQERRYLIGWDTPRYPVPALLMDSEECLVKRWAEWMDAQFPPFKRY